MNENILFNKTRNVKTPNIGTDGSAGIDFFIPEFNEEFFNDYIDKNSLNGMSLDIFKNKKEIKLKPGERTLIPLGIKTFFDKGTVLIAFNKSGVSVKKGILVGACVIDSDYRGEIHLNLFNCSKNDVILKEGEKIIQFLPIQQPVFNFNEVNNKEYEKISSDEINNKRGTGGFGSTGTK